MLFEQLCRGPVDPDAFGGAGSVAVGNCAQGSRLLNSDPDVPDCQQAFARWVCSAGVGSGKHLLLSHPDHLTNIRSKIDHRFGGLSLCADYVAVRCRLLALCGPPNGLRGCPFIWVDRKRRPEGKTEATASKRTSRIGTKPTWRPHRRYLRTANWRASRPASRHEGLPDDVRAYAGFTAKRIVEHDHEANGQADRRHVHHVEMQTEGLLVFTAG